MTISYYYPLTRLGYYILRVAIC